MKTRRKESTKLFSHATHEMKRNDGNDNDKNKIPTKLERVFSFISLTRHVSFPSSFE